MVNIVWTPSSESIEKFNMYNFMLLVSKKYNLKLSNYNELSSWSINYPDDFWAEIWIYFNIKHECRWDNVLTNSKSMFTSKWFTGAKLNFAENLLSNRDNLNAIEFYNENGLAESITYKKLYSQVSKLTTALKSYGLKKGDRVAAVIPNIPMAIVCMLATASLGAVWTCCSPEFGFQAMLDRFKQIKPKVLIYTDGYFYKEKEYLKLDLIDELIESLKSLQLQIIVIYLRGDSQYIKKG